VRVSPAESMNMIIAKLTNTLTSGRSETRDLYPFYESLKDCEISPTFSFEVEAGPSKRSHGIKQSVFSREC
jgi:hypothetical protein